MSDYWIQTSKQGVYDYTSRAASTPITSGVIAHSLSRIRRFLAHSHATWTVAEHSLLVRDIGLQLLETDHEKSMCAPYLLLHDAHEAFLGDMPAPLKKYLKFQFGFDFHNLEAEADRRIRLDLKIPVNIAGWAQDLIHEADTYALKLERESFMASKHEWKIDDVKIPAKITVNFTQLSHQTLARHLRKEIDAAVSFYAN